MYRLTGYNTQPQVCVYVWTKLSCVVERKQSYNWPDLKTIEYKLQRQFTRL